MTQILVVLMIVTKCGQSVSAAGVQIFCVTQEGFSRTLLNVAYKTILVSHWFSPTVKQPMQRIQ